MLGRGPPAPRLAHSVPLAAPTGHFSPDSRCTRPLPETASMCRLGTHATGLKSGIWPDIDGRLPPNCPCSGPFVGEIATRRMWHLSCCCRM
jgi:hypothetical protein